MCVLKFRESGYSAHCQLHVHPKWSWLSGPFLWNHPLLIHSTENRVMKHWSNSDLGESDIICSVYWQQVTNTDTNTAQKTRPSLTLRFTPRAPLSSQFLCVAALPITHSVLTALNKTSPETHSSLGSKCHCLFSFRAAASWHKSETLKSQNTLNKSSRAQTHATQRQTCINPKLVDRFF